MKLVIQRVLSANVSIDGEVCGEIDNGYMVLLGIGEGDTYEIADKMVEKLYKLRIFEDENGKTNLSASDVDAQLLLVSQFTLYADCKKGNRPSFISAASPDLANELYEYVLRSCREKFSYVACGRFGADMKVSLVNDGPFTIILDSKEIL